MQKIKLTQQRFAGLNINVQQAHRVVAIGVGTMVALEFARGFALMTGHAPHAVIAMVTCLMASVAWGCIWVGMRLTSTLWMADASRRESERRNTIKTSRSQDNRRAEITAIKSRQINHDDPTLHAAISKFARTTAKVSRRTTTSTGTHKVRSSSL